MKGRDLMDIVREARSNWHRIAERLAEDAVEHLRRAAKDGETSRRFGFGEQRVSRHIVRIARSILRDEGINLSYSAGRSGEFSVSIQTRIQREDYDECC